MEIIPFWYHANMHVRIRYRQKCSQSGQAQNRFRTGAGTLEQSRWLWAIMLLFRFFRIAFYEVVDPSHRHGAFLCPTGSMQGKTVTFVKPGLQFLLCLVAARLGGRSLRTGQFIPDTASRTNMRKTLGDGLKSI